MDENNGKAKTFEKNNGQYRVNFDNDADFNPASAQSGFNPRPLYQTGHRCDADAVEDYIVE
ncbi:MAG: hypothetical protein LBB61_04405 [Treponema sp.]|nr:hypothetical protein [Treponema sp.]